MFVSTWKISKVIIIIIIIIKYKIDHKWGFYYLEQVKDNNMRKYCSCAGEYDNTVSLQEFGQQLRTFKGIARSVFPHFNVLKCKFI